jgi:hypothetical protein
VQSLVSASNTFLFKNVTTMSVKQFIFQELLVLMHEGLTTQTTITSITALTYHSPLWVMSGYLLPATMA